MCYSTSLIWIEDDAQFTAMDENAAEDEEGSEEDAEDEDDAKDNTKKLHLSCCIQVVRDTVLAVIFDLSSILQWSSCWIVHSKRMPTELPKLVWY